MSTNVLDSAKAVPTRLETLLGALFSGSQKTVVESVTSLKQALGEVQGFADGIETLAARYGAGRGVAQRKRPAPGRKRSRRRGPAKGFQISAFLREKLGQSPKGLRPIEMARMANINAISPVIPSSPIKPDPPCLGRR